MVEMRGIEPRSDSNATGLLRVQFAKEFLGLSVSRKLGRLEQAQSTKSPLIPIDKELKTDLATGSGGQGEVGAVVIGTYWFETER